MMNSGGICLQTSINEKRTRRGKEPAVQPTNDSECHRVLSEIVQRYTMDKSSQNANLILSQEPRLEKPSKTCIYFLAFYPLESGNLLSTVSSARPPAVLALLGRDEERGGGGGHSSPPIFPLSPPLRQLDFSAV